jgi:hypothetical protein
VSASSNVCTSSPALLAGLARRDGELDIRVDAQPLPPDKFQDLQLLVTQVLFVGGGTQIGDDFAHHYDLFVLNLIFTAR